MSVLERLGLYLREHQRWILISLLAVLHLTLLAGANTVISLMCWLVDVGLFILWQPFMQTERRLGPNTLALIVLALAGGAWIFGWWLLILWVVILAALLGGRVLLLGHRPTRIFYLLAFAYLLGALLVFLVPKVVPDSELIGPSLERLFAVWAPLIFVVMLLLPRPREFRLPSGGMVDFFYSLFIFLLISVLILGSLTFMMLRQTMYIEAVFKTLVSMAAMLLLIAWAWNPRPGFSGIGVFLSRYLLTIGLPFETWLQRLMECAEQEGDPDKFLSSACERMLELPWVVGGAWRPAGDAEAGSGCFGLTSPHCQDFQHYPLVLTLYTRHKLSPSLIWHFHLLSQLTNEYYIAKRRFRQLLQISYLRAVHETGARLTHDVKNLLQSLNNLCFLAQEQVKGEADAERLNQLLQRQLPQITQRLQQTLEKLQTPQGAQYGDGAMPAETWWEALRQRYAHQRIVFSDAPFEAGATVPGALFDSVVDNLLHNALLKRQSEHAVLIRVTLSGDGRCLTVADNGRAIDAAIAALLFRAPVPSGGGLGIGLYHAARQAEASAYALRLAENTDGNVSFELTKR